MGRCARCNCATCSTPALYGGCEYPAAGMTISTGWDSQAFIPVSSPSWSGGYAVLTHPNPTYPLGTWGVTTAADAYGTCSGTAFKILVLIPCPVPSGVPWIEAKIAYGANVSDCRYDEGEIYWPSGTAGDGAPAIRPARPFAGSGVSTAATSRWKVGSCSPFAFYPHFSFGTPAAYSAASFSATVTE